ncbi:hypothetical protein SIID45300_01010 [Candidatus Magnetaquicoccaceae bacterium FCR-1]|uniref:Uncharacterized protein n=1 Tax=Candidatus Magnetaquiglobus chichijimensis TaxID=3141448 RepID=A0ABQ0C736_9PROT
MNIDLLDIVRGQLRRTRTPPSSRIDLPLNAEESEPGKATGAILKMDEYEQELLLSPLFTPVQGDRAECEAALAPAGLSLEAQGAMLATLASETLSCPVRVGGHTGYLPLPEVVVDRYLRLLGLDRPVDEGVATAIDQALTGDARHLAMSLARRPVWSGPAASDLLRRLVSHWARLGTLSDVRLAFLTDFVRTYRCRTEPELIRSLRSLLESYRIDPDHPYYQNPALEEKQAESIRSHQCDETVRLHRVSMAREILEDGSRQSS